MFTIGLIALLSSFLLMGLRPTKGYIDSQDNWLAALMLIGMLLICASLLASIPMFLRWTWEVMP